MNEFKFIPTLIDKLIIIEPFFVEDSRGFFLKSYEEDIYSQNNIEFDCCEDFESFSYYGVVRGLHFQTKKPQAKLVRAINGKIFDVAVDLRQGSPTFGRWESVILSEENHKLFYIPPGFAHGFAVLSKTALVSYKCEGKYNKANDTGIVWNDSDIGISWPEEIKKIAVLSVRDACLQTLSSFLSEYEGL